MRQKGVKADLAQQERIDKSLEQMEQFHHKWIHNYYSYYDLSSFNIHIIQLFICDTQLLTFIFSSFIFSSCVLHHIAFHYIIMLLYHYFVIKIQVNNFFPPPPPPPRKILY